jgi:hypothetical protein
MAERRAHPVNYDFNNDIESKEPDTTFTSEEEKCDNQEENDLEMIDGMEQTPEYLEEEFVPEIEEIDLNEKYEEEEEREVGKNKKEESGESENKGKFCLFMSVACFVVLGFLFGSPCGQCLIIHVFK